MLTQARLKELLKYDPKTGLFTWRVSRQGVQVGAVAGYNLRGYIKIKVDGKHYFAHRLAHLYMEGYFPEYQMDHKKGIRHDNRWKELRHVTPLCNLQNCKKYSTNTSGYNGVSWVRSDRKWRSQIVINHKGIYLGSFDDPISAALARCEFEKCCPDWHCNHQAVNFVKLRALGYTI